MLMHMNVSQPHTLNRELQPKTTTEILKYLILLKVPFLSSYFRSEQHTRKIDKKNT